MDYAGSDVEIEPLINLTSPSTSLRPGVTSPSTPSCEQSIDLKIGSLATLFPNAKQSDIIYAVMNNDNLDSAAVHLSAQKTILILLLSN